MTDLPPEHPLNRGELRGWFRPVFKPYPTDPDAYARVEMARSAEAWLDDIRAYLVEQELTTDLAETVAGLMDVSGWSMQTAVAQMRTCMLPEHGGTHTEVEP